MSRSQSDLTQVKAVIEELNNKEKRSIPLGYHPQVRITRKQDIHVWRTRYIEKKVSL